MNTNRIRAQIIVTWQELNQLGITGILKYDTVYIIELNHYTMHESIRCALVANIQNGKEWVIPVKYLNIIINE